MVNGWIKNIPCEYFFVSGADISPLNTIYQEKILQNWIPARELAAGLNVFRSKLRGESISLSTQVNAAIKRELSMKALTRRQ